MQSPAYISIWYFLVVSTPTASRDPHRLPLTQKSCGLAPKKTKAIVETSKILIDQHNSKVPKDINLVLVAAETGLKADFNTKKVIYEFAFQIDRGPSSHYNAILFFPAIIEVNM